MVQARAQMMGFFPSHPPTPPLALDFEVPVSQVVKLVSCWFRDNYNPCSSGPLWFRHLMAGVKSNIFFFSNRKKRFFEIWFSKVKINCTQCHQQDSADISNSVIRLYMSFFTSASFLLQSLLTISLRLLALARYICKLLPTWHIFMWIHVWQEHHLPLCVSGHFSRCPKQLNNTTPWSTSSIPLHQSTA